MSRTDAIRLVTAICLLGLPAGVAATATPFGRPVGGSAPPQQPAPAPARQKPLVAVVGFENRSTYSADKLWDTSGQLLTAQLLRSGSFRVVAEWDRMKTLFEYDVLRTADIVKTPESRQKASKILLCEYFISGAVTRFDVSQRATTSALSKKKEFQTTVRVDLMMMDPQSGEYVAQGTGEHSVVQSLRGGVTGGQTGTWDPASASEALDKAIAAALAELTHQFQQLDRR
jgi:curli biogenesis system outer membrane secretion channel CsgG